MGDKEVKLVPVKDPNPDYENEKQIPIPDEVHLLAFKPKRQERDESGTKFVTVDQEPLEDNYAVDSGPKRLESTLNTKEFFKLLTTGGVVAKEQRKVYYVGPNDSQQQRYCGPILQIIPSGTYGYVKKNESIFNTHISLQDPEKGEIRYEKDKQASIKIVTKDYENDYALIIGENGCVLVESGGMCLMDLPLILVEPKGTLYGEYFSPSEGKRDLKLGHGANVVLHVKEMPILYIRRRQVKSIPDHHRDGIWYEGAKNAANNLKSESQQLMARRPDVSQSVQDLLDEHKIKVNKFIAEGGFAVVLKGKMKSETVAVKVIDKTKLNPIVRDKYLPRELKFAESLTHDNLIRTHSTKSLDNHAVIVMQFADGRDMIDDLVAFGCVLEKDSRVWMTQLIAGLKHMHDNGIAHRDVKLDNILLVNNVATLCDYSLSCYALDIDSQEVVPNKSYCGSCEYLAPEVFAKEAHDPRASDIWSLGVCLYVMTTFMFPFGSKDKKLIEKRQRSGKWKYPQEITVSEKLDALFKKVFVVSHTDRPNAEQFADDEWLKDTSQQ